MRRILVASALLIALSLPAQAAPRRDDGPGSGFLERLEQKIVRVIKRIVPLDDFVPTVSKP
jgi:hypothetical protein